MNVGKLKAYESEFLSRYPDGFYSPELEELGKKHKMDKMVVLAEGLFKEEAFDKPEQFCSQLIKLVTASSMVSLFEKPKFRDGINAMTYEEREALTAALKELFYGDEGKGFEAYVACLHAKRLAKWPLVTAPLAYFRPHSEVFVKPTTVKGIIKHLELEGMTYSPSPSYGFYCAYRAAVNEMKTLVDPTLSPSNAAFSGFLMMVMEEPVPKRKSSHDKGVI